MLACLAAGADAEATGTPQWKGVTWGMLPLHTSGIVACTYHLFYNAPAVTYCVTLQAAMTCLGNTTLAYACLRLALASGWTWEMGKADVLGALRCSLPTDEQARRELSRVTASGHVDPPRLREVVEPLLEAGVDKDLQDNVRRLGACARLPPRPVLTVVSPSPLSDRTVARP